MVRDTANEMARIIEGMESGLSDWVEGYQTRISDGTCMAGTDHRLEVLQATVASALPGTSLVVFDPKLKLVRDVFLCEDGYGQECTLFGQWLETVEPRQLWKSERNTSTLGVVFGIAQRQAAFLIRQHQSSLGTILVERAMFQIDFTPDTLEDLQLFRAYEQRQIIEAIETQLPYQPTQPTWNRK